MKILMYSVLAGVVAVNLTALITHFVIGDFTEMTIFAGVLAAGLTQHHLRKKQASEYLSNG